MCKVTLAVPTWGLSPEGGERRGEDNVCICEREKWFLGLVGLVACGVWLVASGSGLGCGGKDRFINSQARPLHANEGD